MSIVDGTEANVREFFDNLATKIVSLSEQSRELASLRVEFDTMKQQLDGLQHRNESLSKNIAETWEFARRMETEADQAKASAKEWEDKAHVLENQHDELLSKHESLVATHNGLTDQHEEVQNELSQAHHDLNNVRQENVRLHSQVERLENERAALSSLAAERYEQVHQARMEATEARLERDKTKAKLDSIRNLFAEQAGQAAAEPQVSSFRPEEIQQVEHNPPSEGQGGEVQSESDTTEFRQFG